MSAPALTVTGLTGGYRGRTVIRGLSLSPIAAGGITALVGPNAAGKSTLLRILAGLLPASGRLSFAGTDLMALDLTARSRHVAFMPQTLPQGAALTVLEAVMSALKASPSGVAAAEASHAALSALDRLGIGDLALAPLDRLSGGQRQLASLAQAIVRKPAILLLDEPTSALDLRHQVEVMTVLQSLAAEGALVIMVIHDLALAARWSDHVVVLSQGAAYAQGEPAAAITPAMLAEVYGVDARVETCSRGHLQIMVEGARQRSLAS